MPINPYCCEVGACQFCNGPTPTNIYATISGVTYCTCFGYIGNFLKVTSGTLNGTYCLTPYPEGAPDNPCIWEAPISPPIVITIHSDAACTIPSGSVSLTLVRFQVSFGNMTFSVREESPAPNRAAAFYRSTSSGVACDGVTLTNQLTSCPIGGVPASTYAVATGGSVTLVGDGC